jgi:tetratricopeptide (TPR) repeat protein
MSRLFRRFLSRLSLLLLPLGLFAVVCVGQDGLTRECKEKDYVCRYNNYMRIVFAKCVKTKVYDYDCFVAEQTKIVEANPDDVAAYIYRGIIYSGRDPARAIADFNRVLELDQLYEPAYTSLASAFKKKGDYIWALTFLNRGIELFPESANIYEFRGYTYLEQRQFGKALTDFNKVIELSPDSDDGFIGRAKLYSVQGELDKALAEYDKAIGLNPRGWRSYYDRGFIYWGRGDKVKAGADCQKAKELKRYERQIPPEHISNEYCTL